MRATSAEVIDDLPVKSGGKSIVVVLGMHRSGTSAITRGLTVLGVELGDRLMPPKENINDRGFFEDIDINAINVALYRSLRSRQRWHSLIPVPTGELLGQKNAPLRLQAIELLKSRLENVEYFGIKDPRICCTLPFWQSIFEHLQLDVSYVIAIRNPISVARSLEKRNNFPLEKSYYLWLDHVLPSVLLTQGAPRVLVDYDLLLADPYKQISRMAIHLGLAKRLDAARLAEFSQSFLDKRLRHANFDLEDIYHDPTVPPPVKRAAAVLSDVATGHLDLDSEYVAEVFANLSQARKPFRLIGKEVLLSLFRLHKKK